MPFFDVVTIAPNGRGLVHERIRYDDEPQRRAISRGDLMRLSRLFLAGGDLRFEQDRRINDWLKGLLEATYAPEGGK